MQHLTSLLSDCDALSEIYLKMQDSYNNRLSKISLFISKIDDVRSLCHSGCRWLIKESLKREEEIRMCEKSKLDEVSAHSTALDAIELDVAAILTNRMEWIRSFTGKSKESIEVLEKIYVEISSTALDGLESEEDKLSVLYKDYYVQKEKYLKLFPVKPSAQLLPVGVFRKRLTRSSAAHELQDLEDARYMSLRGASDGDYSRDRNYLASAELHDRRDDTPANSNIEPVRKARRGEKKKASRSDLRNQQSDIYNQTESNGEDGKSSKNCETIGNQPVHVLDNDSDDSDSDDPIITTTAYQSMKLLKPNARGIAQRNREKLHVDSRSRKAAIVLDVESDSPNKPDRSEQNITADSCHEVTPVDVQLSEPAQDGVTPGACDHVEAADSYEGCRPPDTDHVDSADISRNADDSTALADMPTESVDDPAANLTIHDSPNRTRTSSPLEPPISPLYDDSPEVTTKPIFKPLRKTPIPSPNTVIGCDTNRHDNTPDLNIVERHLRMSSRVHADSKINISNSSSEGSSSSKRRKTGTPPSCSSFDAIAPADTHPHTMSTSLQDSQLPNCNSSVATRDESDTPRRSEDCDGRDRDQGQEQVRGPMTWADPSSLVPGGSHEDGIDLTDDS